MNLPSAFLTRMQEMLGEEYEAFLQSYESGHYQSLRLNPRKTDREEFTEKSPFHLTPVHGRKTVFITAKRIHRASTRITRLVFIIFRKRARWRLSDIWTYSRGLCAGSVRCPRREKHPDRCCDAGKRYFSLQ